MTSPCDPCTWPHPVTLARGLCAAQLNSWSWVDWAPLYGFAKSATSSERQRSVVSARDVSRHFFRLRWASLLINLVCLLLGWSFYNFESSTPNRSASPFEKRRNRRFKLDFWLSYQALYFAIAMAGPCGC